MSNRHDPPQRLTTAEAAAYTGVADSTLRTWRHVDKGPRSYALLGKVLYDLQDLDAWIAAEKAKTVRGGVGVAE